MKVFKRCHFDKKNRLICPNKHGRELALSNFDLKNGTFVIGGYTYTRWSLSSHFDHDTLEEILWHIQSQLDLFKKEVADSVHDDQSFLG